MTESAWKEAIAHGAAEYYIKEGQCYTRWKDQK